MATKVDDKVLNESAETDNFAALLEASFKSEKQNSIKEGVIVEIRDDIILLDIGQKSEGRLNTNEVKDKDGNIDLNVGDNIKVVVVGSYNGAPIVSWNKAKALKNNEEFIKNYKPDPEKPTVVECKVIGKNRGGFIAENSDKVSFFLPKSQVPFKRVQDLVGQNIKAVITKADEDNQSIVISMKKFISINIAQRDSIIKEIMQSDEIRPGIIKKITSYGMFVDIGNVEGLVHYSEISHRGSVNPSSLYKEGEGVEVKVIKYDDKKGHLSLSIKAAIPNPWDEIQDVLEVGDTIQVTVNSIEPYGAFVDLGNDVEGFLHISEISWENNLSSPEECIKVGDEIDVEVVEINIPNKRLRVSLKNLLPKPFDTFIDKYKEGDTAKGKITSITDFGAFVKIDSIEGLLHNENLSWDRSVKAKDILKKDDEIEVQIASINKMDHKISLSKKALEKSPIQEYTSKNKAGDIVKGKITSIKDFGTFVALSENVESLIRDEDLGELKKDELKVDQDIEAVIAHIDIPKNRIRISVKQLGRAYEKEALKEFNASNSDDDKMTLGDLLDNKLN